LARYSSSTASSVASSSAPASASNTNFSRYLQKLRWPLDDMILNLCHSTNHVASRSPVTFRLFTYSSPVHHSRPTIHQPCTGAGITRPGRPSSTDGGLGVRLHNLYAALIAESRANGVQAPRQLFARRRRRRRPGLANPANGAHLLHGATASDHQADRRAQRHSGAWFDCMALSTLIVTNTLAGTANYSGLM